MHTAIQTFGNVPEHFLSEHSAARHRYAYIPFGAGARTCIGNHFALLEITLVIATIAQRYRLKNDERDHIETEVLGTLRPVDDLRMQLLRRGDNLSGD